MRLIEHMCGTHLELHRASCVKLWTGILNPPVQHFSFHRLGLCMSPSCFSALTLEGERHVIIMSCHVPQTRYQGLKNQRRKHRHDSKPVNQWAGSINRYLKLAHLSGGWKRVAVVYLRWIAKLLTFCDLFPASTSPSFNSQKKPEKEARRLVSEVRLWFRTEEANERDAARRDECVNEPIITWSTHFIWCVLADSRGAGVVINQKLEIYFHYTCIFECSRAVLEGL